MHNTSNTNNGGGGFLSVGQMQMQSMNDLAARNKITLPQKQAIKMTQMPIFIADVQSSHRTVMRKKETP